MYIHHDIYKLISKRNILFTLTRCIAYYRLLFSDIKVGDIVVLSSDIDEVKMSYFNISKRYIWHKKMISMRGNQYPVLKVVPPWYHVPLMVALPSPDGSQNGKWYFPVNVVSKPGNVFYIF